MSKFENCKYPYLNPELPLNNRIDDLISRMTLEEKIGLIPTRQAAVERLGIKEYWVGGEAAHGVVARTGDATVFPQPIGLSSTWDPELLHQIGSVIGDEARIYYKKNGERGGLTLWAPTIDMERDPRWGRTEEAYGEDPYLTGKLSAELVKGMQGDHPFYLKLVPAPKHFYGNNNEEGRIWASTSIDPRNKHEYYLKAFKPAYTEGKAYSMMTAYNEINGTPCIVNPEVQRIVKDEWGCDGFVVCDGGDMSQTVEYHKYYETHAETIANAIKNGVDVMTDDAELVRNSTREAVERGLLSEAELNKAVRNIFKVRFRLGHFDPEDINPYANIPESVLCCEEHNALALKAAREAVVLLKNENNMLPLKKEKINKVAVIGPLGDVIYRDWYTGTHPYKVTPLQGIINKLEGKEILYKDGNDTVRLKSTSSNRYLSVKKDNDALLADKVQAGPEETFALTDWGWGSCTLKAKANDKYITTDDKIVSVSAPDIWGWFVKEAFHLQPENEDTVTIKTWNGKAVVEGNSGNGSLKVTEDNTAVNGGRFIKEIVSRGSAEAAEAARESDVAIVFVGNHPLINAKEEIDRSDITLAPAQEDLIKAVYAANPNTIVVIVGSYPMAINWADVNVPAILYSAHGCQELGNAIADVLFGDYSPSGRLSMTWYSSVNQLSDIRDYDIINGKRTYMYFEGRPLYPFGYGLSYTNFEYGSLFIDNKIINSDGEATLSIDVINKGSADSDEVVQMYVKINNSRVKRPVKELKGFKRIHLQAGERKTVTFNLKAADLAFWDVTREKYCVETGEYVIMVGCSSEDIKSKALLRIEGETVPPRDLTKVTMAENYDGYTGVILHECKGNGTCVCNINNGAWIKFENTAFNSEVESFETRVSSNSEGGYIEIRLDDVEGKLAGTCHIPSTGNWQAWQMQQCKVSDFTELHDIYLVLNGNIRLNWFKFNYK